MIVWDSVYILYLLCNIAILLFEPFSTLILLPLLVILWPAAVQGGHIFVFQGSIRHFLRNADGDMPPMLRKILLKW